ncbi:hypothetical protein O3M35_002027 [Rhynocoris fuscipes]|uniref:Amino acid transporter transmembrane domain-containing protein n=1 Tax=Rhynocoris fuscipes TaxID=488301 RepID=A0AAW1CSV3_9HEMI
MADKDGNYGIKISLGYNENDKKVQNNAVSKPGSEMKLRKISNAFCNDGSESAVRENTNKKYADNTLKCVYITTPNMMKSPQSDKDYEPYDHREVSHPTTYFETLIHMLKASLGTGILAMPDAFNNAGYMVATIGTLAIGFLCTYSIHILISSEYELCRRKRQPSMNYPATAIAAIQEGPKFVKRFNRFVPHICNSFLMMYQIGSCCIYLLFITSNVKDVADYYSEKNYGVETFNERYYMLILLLPLILIGWVRNLKYLAPLSTAANFVTLISFAIIFYYMFTDIPDIKDRVPVAPIATMPLYFGTVLFAMESIGVVMPLENGMKNPKNFVNTLGVLNCAMIPITLLYTLVGFFGYLKYGSDVQGSITLSLPRHEILAQSARIMLAFAIFVTHALSCYVAFDITWRQYIEPKVKNRKILWEYTVRTVLVIICFILAAAVPDLNRFISLIGALCLSTMGLAFPALIQLFTYWYDYDGMRFGLLLLKNSIIVIIAVLGFVIGIVTSIEAIIDDFKNHKI